MIFKINCIKNIPQAKKRKEPGAAGRQAVRREAVRAGIEKFARKNLVKLVKT
jgi:hypothetical protein